MTLLLGCIQIDVRTLSKFGQNAQYDLLQMTSILFTKLCLQDCQTELELLFMRNGVANDTAQ